MPIRCTPACEPTVLSRVESERVDPASPPYWQYLERFNARRAPAPVDGAERGRSSTDQERQGASAGGGEGVSLGMPRLGEVFETPAEARPKNQVERAFMQERMLPSGNVIDVFG